jgi:hypothetical protein
MRIRNTASTPAGTLPVPSTTVVDQKLFVTDPDPTFQRVSDPYPTLKKFLILFWILFRIRPYRFALPPELRF